MCTASWWKVLDPLIPDWDMLAVISVATHNWLIGQFYSLHYVELIFIHQFSLMVRIFQPAQLASIREVAIIRQSRTYVQEGWSSSSFHDVILLSGWSSGLIFLTIHASIFDARKDIRHAHMFGCMILLDPEGGHFELF